MRLIPARLAPIVEQFRRNVVGRREPHGITSLRFLLPRLSAEQRRHRRLLASSMPSLPRPVFLLLNGFLWLRWMSFEAWRQVGRVAGARSEAVVEAHGISASEQQRVALRLALMHGIGPKDFYDLELFLPERRAEMWGNVFTNEIGAFHAGRSLVHGGALARIHEQSSLLSDKAATCRRLEVLGVSASVELQRIAKGSKSGALDALSAPVFCKPNVGNAARGAFRAEVAHGALLVEPVIGVVPKDPREYVDRVMAQHELLVERFLDPHPLFVDSGTPPDLAVVARIITEASRVVCAYVEVPWTAAAADGRRVSRFSPLRIDVATGRIGGILVPTSIADRDDDVRRSAGPLENRVIGARVPYWTETVAAVESASAICPDVYGIAWDVAICPEGPVVIEGNTGWSVVIPQRVLGPLVARELGGQ